MPRRNRRSGAAQQRRRPDGQKAAKKPPPPALEALILPRGRCYYRSKNGKLRFSAEDAPKALAQAQANRARRNTGHVEERYYHCDEPGGCGDYHLTSRTAYNDRSKS